MSTSSDDDADDFLLAAPLSENAAAVDNVVATIAATLPEPRFSGDVVLLGEDDNGIAAGYHASSKCALAPKASAVFAAYFISGGAAAAGGGSTITSNSAGVAPTNMAAGAASGALIEAMKPLGSAAAAPAAVVAAAEEDCRAHAGAGGVTLLLRRLRLPGVASQDLKLFLQQISYPTCFTIPITTVRRWCLAAAATQARLLLSLVRNTRVAAAARSACLPDPLRRQARRSKRLALGH